jgi:hypothetical protein
MRDQFGAQESTVQRKSPRLTSTLVEAGDFVYPMARTSKKVRGQKAIQAKGHRISRSQPQPSVSL